MNLNQIWANDKKWFGIGIVAVVIVILLVIFIKPQSPSNNNTNQKETAQGFVSSNPNSLPTVQGGTREKVTTNIPTPGVGASSTPANIAVPTNVVETGNIASRWFEITGQNNEFSPNTIVVNAGDVINVTLKAVDQDYNMSFPDLGVTVSAKQGATAKAQFQASTYGQYTFNCTVCRGTVSGTLVVNQK